MLSALALVIATPASAATSHAAGDPTLAAQIVSPAQSDWTTLPAGQVQSLVKQLTSNENLTLSALHGTSSVAAQLWRRGSRGSLEIALVAVRSTIGKNPALDTRIRQSAAAAANAFCEGSVGVAPQNTGTIPKIPGSVVGECPVSNGHQYILVSWAHNGVLAIIATSLSALTLKELVALAKSQYAAMATGSSSSSSSTVIIVAVVVAALVVLGLIVALTRRGSSATSATTPRGENDEGTDHVDGDGDDEHPHDDPFAVVDIDS